MYTQNDINKQALEVMWRTDGYKLGHYAQFPDGTTKIYSNLTPRSVYGGANEERPPVVVMYGLKKLLQRMVRDFDVFFNSDIAVVRKLYEDRMERFSGTRPNTEHLQRLYDIGYLPLEIKAIPEGALGLVGQPLLTITNTDPSAYWLVNYLETWISSDMWQAITSATTAWNVRRLMDSWCIATGGDPAGNWYLAHDFSYRGLPGMEAAVASGSAHLLSFYGSDSLSSWDLIEATYPETDGVIQIGVPASEHSVMTVGAVQREDGTMDEREQLQRLLDIYPTGIVSVVSDSYDYWGMVSEVLPEFRNQIMERDGKWVVRPDSGDPVKIVTGDPDAPEGTPERRGTLDILWDTFGGTVNEAGYRELDSHIGIIYGDSMTWSTINRMCERMEATGYATTNIVFGLGSFGYQYVTRDTYGFAVKATWAEVDGKPKPVFKDPKTGNGNKKSARGLLKLVDDGSERKLIEDITVAEEAAEPGEGDLLKLMFRNGELVGFDENFQIIRERLLKETKMAEERGWLN